MTETPREETERLHGRNRISSRAIRSVVTAITSSALGTPAASVGVELSDDGGALVVTAVAPIRISALAASGRQHRQPTATVLERAAAAQDSIRAQVLELTGSAVGAVRLRISSATIDREARVQ